jgi:S1-C subfamily serine protease
VKFNGQDIIDAQQLIDIVNKAHVGQTVEMSYWHGPVEQTINIMLTETPKPQ